ncbi:hypothetical protein A3D68_01550 [Candidatus Adlerbacteria bacterium RIFCSPHIGHO2_02_FULL_52_17]|uniref:Uncharacterized protein n=1 Tax=Candidatus Adlerbacteria bacterium RIFCSPHIGHO2_02_FULL_52_17 TaxID=1797240 RepID=A0A1F4XQ28_9BACT|nr:MAG: hypothetical protein A3D68_01550 [Candidatus Adlerbacteria bacterium RIFCSPHIGHO2_02_FULL_52_17]
MSPFFKKKKRQEKTIAMLDVESGSVGATLVRISPTLQPRLFAEVRIPIAPLRAVSGSALATQVERAAREALRHISSVAARVRNAPNVSARSFEELSNLSTIDRVAMFLHPPWAGVDFDQSGKALPGAVPEFLDFAQTLSEETFGSVPLSLYSFGASAAPLLHTLYAVEDPCLMCSLTGEMTELVVVDHSGVVGHGTLPLGTNFLVRTLASHGGFSLPEAHSALSLFASGGTHPQILEPLYSASDHFMREFSDAAMALVKAHATKHIFLIAPHGAGQWLTRSMTEHDTSSIFPDGGTIRTVGPQHLTPHVAAHGSIPDTALLVGALFIDARLSRV